MTEFLRTIALLLAIHGGTLDCPPVSPPACTLFVDSVLAFDVGSDPWGKVAVERWNPAEWIIGEEVDNATN